MLFIIAAVLDSRQLRAFSVLARTGSFTQAAREHVLTLGRDGQKSLPSGGAIRNRDETFFFQEPQTPRQCRAVNDQQVPERPDGNRLVFRDAH